MQQGTPWWLTIVLVLAAGLLAHFLTAYREKNKAASDQINGWREKFSDLLVSTCDLASTHYSSPAEIANTHTSACLILNNLKRLSSMMREVHFLESSRSKSFQGCYQRLHYVITGTNDFQDPNRDVRQATDPLFEEIRAAEDSLMQLSKEKIKPKPTRD